MWIKIKDQDWINLNNIVRIKKSSSPNIIRIETVRDSVIELECKNKKETQELLTLIEGQLNK